MANRVTMTICGTEYILVAEEDAAYMEKIGGMVDAEMQALMDSAHISRDAAAVLAAVNLADQLTKAQENAENLRRQVKTYLDEAGRAKNEAAELRRKLQNAQNQNNRRG
jgi:cell division protein ZapA